MRQFCRLCGFSFVVVVRDFCLSFASIPTMCPALSEEPRVPLRFQITLSQFLLLVFVGGWTFNAIHEILR